MSFTDKMKRTNDHHWLHISLKLANGETMSVQASEYHYCFPRKDLNDVSMYQEFEIGFPSFVDERLLPFAEDKDNPTETVYGYVPKHIIQAIVDDAGGIIEDNSINPA